MAASHFMSCPSPEDTCPSKLFSLLCLGLWYKFGLIRISIFFLDRSQFITNYDPIIHVTIHYKL